MGDVLETKNQVPDGLLQKIMDFEVDGKASEDKAKVATKIKIFTEQDATRILQKYGSDVSAQEKITLSALATIKQGDEKFFSDLLQHPNTVPVSALTEFIKDTRYFDAIKNKTVIMTSEELSEFFSSISGGTHKDFLTAQEHETVHIDDLALSNTTSTNKELFGKRQQVFQEKLTQELGTTKGFSADVITNMSAGLLHRRNKKFTTYATSQNSADKSDLYKQYTLPPFGPEAETVIGKFDWQRFFDTVKTQATSLLTTSGNDADTSPLPVSLDRCNALMDPTKVTSLMDTFQKDGTIALELSQSPYVREEESKKAVASSMELIVSRMQQAKEASGVKNLGETMKSFLHEFKSSGFLEIFKEVCATLKEVFESLRSVREDDKSSLDAATSDPRQLAAVEHLVKKHADVLKDKPYNETTFPTIKTTLVDNSDPTHLEQSFRSSIGVDGYKKIFAGSSIIDPLQNPSALRELLIEKMGTALGKNSTELTEMKKTEKQETSYKLLLGTYLDKKKTDRPESERKFNTPSSDGKAYGAERFARAIFTSLLSNESKAKLSYEQIPSSEVVDDDLYMLNTPLYTYDATTGKITFSHFGAIKKYGVQVGDNTSVNHITANNPSIDVKGQTPPFMLHLSQRSDQKNNRHETHKLDLPCENISATVSGGVVTVKNLDINTSYDATWNYTKEGVSESVTTPMTLDKKTPTQSFTPTLGSGETLEYVRIRRKTTPDAKQHPRQKIPLAPATSA